MPCHVMSYQIVVCYQNLTLNRYIFINCDAGTFRTKSTVLASQFIPKKCCVPLIVSKPAIIAIAVAIAVVILLIFFCCCKRWIMKKWRKKKEALAKKGLKGAVDLKSVQLLGKEYKEKVRYCARVFTIQA